MRFTSFLRNARPFSEIPSPKCYPVLKHSYLFFKNGPYSKDKLTEAFFDLSLKYGPIFNLKFPGQKDFIITVDAENAKIVFHNEGKYPYRVVLPALALYHQKTFGTIGVIPGNGVHWYKLRKTLSPLLSKKYLSSYNTVHEAIADKFVHYVKNKRNENQILTNVCSHVYRYSIECMSSICPGEALTDENELHKIIQGSCTFMDGLYRTYSEPPIWKFISTTGYKRLKRGHDIINEFMQKEMSKPIDQWNDSFMKILFENPDLSSDEAKVLATEVFLSGIDSISTAITMTIYYLSKNERCQTKALDDVKNGSLSYMRACFKESLRLSSTAGGTSRTLPIPVVMNGYVIPANTNITVIHSATSLMEKYFEDVHLYKPERWLRSEKAPKKDEFSHYASLPFGHGPRMCPGRWLSEQESVIILSALLQRFKFQSAVSVPINMIFRMNRIPDRSVDIKFIDRM